MRPANKIISDDVTFSLSLTARIYKMTLARPCLRNIQSWSQIDLSLDKYFMSLEMHFNLSLDMYFKYV